MQFSHRRTLPLALALSLAACGGTVGGPAVPRLSKPSVQTQAAIGSKIKHVVVVVLENRSFDNMFQFLDHSKADIADIDTSAKSMGMPVTLQPQTLSASQTDTGHSHSNYLQDYDAGANDGWPAFAYAYVPQVEVQPDLDIANQFAISDRFFHGVTAPTFPSHVEIGGASTYGVIDNPSDETWGCDAKPGTTTGLFDANAPGEEIAGAGPFPCFDELSIFDLLDRGNGSGPVSWYYYDEPQGYSATGNENIAGFYRHIRYGPDWNTDVGQSDAEFIPALTTGLPAVSFIIPNETSTDHAGTPSLGPTYLKTLVNAFGTSQYFDDTLMIITWDDWGGWYDHVVPPHRADGSELSWRKPIMFVGGYVKHGFVSHVQTEDASIAKTIENVFGLGTLGTHDVLANDFSDVVDVTQTPAAFVPITSNQGVYALAPPLPSPVPTLPIDENWRAFPHRSAFRVIPANLLGTEGGKRYDADHDYYGLRSADY